jgi:hypothetical protein
MLSPHLSSFAIWCITPRQSVRVALESRSSRNPVHDSRRGVHQPCAAVRRCDDAAQQQRLDVPDDAKQLRRLVERVADAEWRQVAAECAPRLRSLHDPKTAARMLRRMVQIA